MNIDHDKRRNKHQGLKQKGRQNMLKHILKTMEMIAMNSIATHQRMQHKNKNNTKEIKKRSCNASHTVKDFTKTRGDQKHPDTNKKKIGNTKQQNRSVFVCVRI